VTRDELVEQIPAKRKKFPDYKSYADATLNNIFSPEELKESVRLEANHLETTLFVGSHSGQFSPVALPLEAQYSPVYATAFNDFDGDGHIDVLLCGNDSKSKIKIGKQDANHGTFLKGDGKRHFVYVPQWKSGLKLRGDVRSIVQLNDRLWFSVNESPLEVYQINQFKQKPEVLALGH
jgi:hypothetical protein